MIASILEQLKPYMLYENHLRDWVCIKPSLETKHIVIPDVETSSIVKNPHTRASTITIPKHIQDTLFWCFYMIVEGYHTIDYIFQSPFKYEQEFKYKCIAKLKPKLSVLKSLKINIQLVESDVVMNKFMTLSNLEALAMAQEKSIIVKCDELYYDFNYGTSYYLIERRGHTFFLHLGDVNDLISTIQQECYCINPRKVIKSVSAYTLKELQTISEKVKLPIRNQDKVYTKQILYDAICSKIEKLT